MGREAEKRRDKKEEAIIALLMAPNVTEAAKACGVGFSTLRRWLEDPVFVAQYRAARREAVQQMIARSQHYSNEALDTLRDLMRDPDATSSSRVAAARTIIETALNGVELEDVEDRLARIEAALQHETLPGEMAQA